MFLNNELSWPRVFNYFREDLTRRYTVTLWPSISVNGLPFHASRPTVFITHGFFSDGNVTWMDDMKDAYIMQVCSLYYIHEFLDVQRDTWTLLAQLIISTVQCTFQYIVFTNLLFVLLRFHRLVVRLLTSFTSQIVMKVNCGMDVPWTKVKGWTLYIALRSYSFKLRLVSPL